jgi:hypothetical protein
MPLTNAHHGAAPEPFDLGARIEAELRARIEEAVDFVCLEAMVTARKARGAPAPSADNAHDRDEFMRQVKAFLERLRSRLVVSLSDEQRRRLGQVLAVPEPATVETEITVQVALARELPDYWQRLDAIRLGQDGVLPSRGHESPRLIDRLRGR